MDGGADREGQTPPRMSRSWVILLERLRGHRVFEDAQGRMKLGLQDVGGLYLASSQRPGRVRQEFRLRETRRYM